MIVLGCCVQRGDELVVARDVDRVVALDVEQAGDQCAIVLFERSGLRIGPAQRKWPGTAVDVLGVAEVSKQVGFSFGLQKASGAGRGEIRVEVGALQLVGAVGAQRGSGLRGPRSV